MRLLFVGTHSEPGGAATHFTSLTTALASAGHQIAVLAQPGTGIWRTLEADGRIELFPGDFSSKLERGSLRMLSKAVRAVRPDWMMGAFERDYWGAATIATRFRVPLALFLHHAGIKRSSMRVLPWMVQRFVLPSTNLQQWLIGRGIASQRTAVLHNPVDTEHFHRCAVLRRVARLALGVAPDDVLVGYLGRIEENKGVVQYAQALSQAMERMPNLRALWVGFGQLEDSVEQIIQSSAYASRHIRLPWCEDVLPHYAAVDMLALPSTGPEAFGRVLVEAQSCGVPVLGSAVGGISEALQAGSTGELVAPADVDAWTDAICTMAADRAKRQRMGDAGREFVRSNFDNAVIVEEFERLLQ